MSVRRLPHVTADPPSLVRAAMHDLPAAAATYVHTRALWVSEDFQSRGAELRTSSNELESLNHELRAMNDQLQATVERQRTTLDDLQNLLYSTDIAKLVLDSNLNIRFFTPRTEAFFHIIASDIGRPLSDLRAVAPDGDLQEDASAVLRGSLAITREIETHEGVWARKVLPYRTHQDAIEGVVITYTDITERKLAAAVLFNAKRDAELANAAKSRFLAAASHDLRQPMQTLAILQGLLASRLAGTPCEELVTRLDEALGVMPGMLDAMLDINQIEAGVVRAEIVDVRIDDILTRLGKEFAYHAQAKGLALRVVGAGLTVSSDPRLLEQLLRNLVSNAIKYTETGKILLGCRRKGGTLSVEVWDTGIGIPAHELKAIFGEYHQLQNAARERSRGFGLGLSVVQRLGTLLDHPVHACSRPAKASGFGIEVPIQPRGTGPTQTHAASAHPEPTAPAAMRGHSVLVVENEPELRQLLVRLLVETGHIVTAAADGPTAIDLIAGGVVELDVLLMDYNLPNGMNGLVVIAELRRRLGRAVPAIILTGDISTDTLAAIANGRCGQLSKPVRPAELEQAIHDILATRQPAAAARTVTGAGTRNVFVIDGDRNIRTTIRTLLEEQGCIVETFVSSETFLAACRIPSDGCLLVDAYLPGMNGLELIRHLRSRGDALPAIMMTGYSDARMAVHAMKAGAVDFIEKPIAVPELLDNVERALEISRDICQVKRWRDSAAQHIAGLTPRQHEIMAQVLAGRPNKIIAADLGISQRTVENHRAAIMERTGSKSLPALARLAVAAASTSPDGGLRG